MEYRALSEHESPGTTARTHRFDVTTAQVVGLVALCDVDPTPTANLRPSISMSIDQYVQCVDGSMVRLDAERGFTATLNGHVEGEAVSWRRRLDEVVAEVLDLVRADDPVDVTAHPWDDLARAARLRGIEVDAATLATVPYRVTFTAEAVAVFVG